jgi:acetyl esterase/lipase
MESQLRSVRAVLALLGLVIGFGVFGAHGAAAQAPPQPGVSADELDAPSSTTPVEAGLRYREAAGVAAEENTLDIYGGGLSRAPVMIYVHGGGWRRGDKSRVGVKPSAFRSWGWVFVSVNYRLGQANPFEQAQDVAHAVAWVRDNIDRYGGDPDRVFLMGHSAGAHLAALASLSTEVRDSAGLDRGDIDGVVLLDGAGYDVRRQVEDLAGARNRALYENVFGADPTAWTRVSPTNVANAEAPQVLAFYVADRNASRVQSESLVARLSELGVSARAVAAAGKTHASINREFGLEDDAVTREAQAFLDRLTQPSPQ